MREGMRMATQGRTKQHNKHAYNKYWIQVFSIRCLMGKRTMFCSFSSSCLLLLFCLLIKPPRLIPSFKGVIVDHTASWFTLKELKCISVLCTDFFHLIKRHIEQKNTFRYILFYAPTPIIYLPFCLHLSLTHSPSSQESQPVVR